jgi:hypothetical protein
MEFIGEYSASFGLLHHMGNQCIYMDKKMSFISGALLLPPNLDYYERRHIRLLCVNSETYLNAD